MKELRETIHNANLTKTQKMIAKYILDNSGRRLFHDFYRNRPEARRQ